MEAISHAGSCVGITFDSGVLLAAEIKSTSKLLDQDNGKYASDIVKAEKLYKIDDHIGCSVAGITADASILIQNAQIYAQQHLKTYNEAIPVEQLIQQICDLKQGYTQHGGLRPFGVSFLFAGYDKHFGFQLYQSDPSGNYGGWKATAIGSNYQAAQNMIKEDYKVNMTQDEALELITKIFLKNMDAAIVDANKFEYGILSKDEKDRPVFRIIDKQVIRIVIENTKAKVEKEAKANKMD